MIYFAVTTNVELVKWPDWLDSFFQKHNKEKYDFHITLKQPCVIEESDTENITNLISDYVKKNTVREFPILFNKLVADATPEELLKNDACIMIEAESNPEIIELQRRIVNLLSDYSNYLSPETKFYEENFRPHITIAANLNKQEFEEAKKELGNDYACTAGVTQVILSVVRTNGQSKKVERITFDLD